MTYIPVLSNVDDHRLMDITTSPFVLTISISDQKQSH